MIDEEPKTIYGFQNMHLILIKNIHMLLILNILLIDWVLFQVLKQFGKVEQGLLSLWLWIILKKKMNYMGFEELVIKSGTHCI